MYGCTVLYSNIKDGMIQRHDIDEIFNSSTYLGA